MTGPGKSLKALKRSPRVLKIKATSLGSLAFDKSLRFSPALKTLSFPKIITALQSL